MKEVAFFLDKSYEYEDNLRRELKAAGLIVSDREFKSQDPYIITDCLEGTKTGYGYIFYENDDNKGIDHFKAECVILGFDEITPEFVYRMYQRHKKLPWVIAESERLVIREMRLEDVEALYRIYSDEDIKKYCQNLKSDISEEIEFTKAYISTMYECFGYGNWILQEKESGRIIGRAGLEHRDGYSDLELGYLIAKEFRRQGYCYEACREILRVACRDYEQKNLNLFVADDNYKSKALAAKLGFQYLEDCQIDNRRVKRFVYRNLTNFSKNIDNSF